MSLKGVLPIGQTKLIFLCNELLDPAKRSILSLPLHFIRFAHVEGKLFKHFVNQGTFLVEQGRQWGNKVVYGAVFALEDFDFHIRLLDSYHQCSLSNLKFNHVKDVHHRDVRNVTFIDFDSIDELERLMYNEVHTEPCYVYLGNKNHPKINQRLNTTKDYRILDGVDPSFVRQYREVTNGNV